LIAYLLPDAQKIAKIHPQFHPPVKSRFIPLFLIQMATLEVDQSGKWESSSDTIIGISGATLPFSVKVLHRTKNRVSAQLGLFEQEKGRSKKMKIVCMFTYTVFLAVCLAIRKGDRLLIDVEYDGSDDTIRDLLLYLFRRFSNLEMSSDQVVFGHVGKQSMSHIVAYQTFTGRRRAERELLFEDYFRLLDRTAEIRNKAFRKRMRARKDWPR